MVGNVCIVSIIPIVGIVGKVLTMGKEYAIMVSERGGVIPA